MADLVDVKLIDGTVRTVRELFTGRKYGLGYYQREYTWTESNVTEMIDDLATNFLEDFDAQTTANAYATSDRPRNRSTQPPTTHKGHQSED